MSTRLTPDAFQCRSNVNTVWGRDTKTTVENGDRKSKENERTWIRQRNLLGVQDFKTNILQSDSVQSLCLVSPSLPSRL